MELRQVADVILGILVSREKKESGIYKYQLFSFDDYDKGDNQYTLIEANEFFANKLVMKDDIIFRLVCPNKMIYIDKEFDNLLISSQVCIIRAKKDMLDSKFLKWYLESEMGKEQLLLNATGSSIKKISISALKQVKVPLISLEKQKKIGDLIKLWDDEKETVKKIMSKKEILYNSIIEDITLKEDSIINE